jgi:pyruvate dehydrogenase E1 component beta subunit
MPAFPADAKGLLLSAIRDPGPVLFFEHNGLYNTRGDVPPGDETIPIGTASVARQGTDVTLVSYCRSLHLCLESAEQLSADHGLEAEVIDLRTVSPLDEEAILTSIRKTHRLVIVHEANERFGVGAEIAALAASKGFDSLDAPVGRVATKNTPIPFAPLLEKAVLPSVPEIVAAVLSLG